MLSVEFPSIRERKNLMCVIEREGERKGREKERDHKWAKSAKSWCLLVTPFKTLLAIKSKLSFSIKAERESFNSL